MVRKHTKSVKKFIGVSGAVVAFYASLFAFYPAMAISPSGQQLTYNISPNITVEIENADVNLDVAPSVDGAFSRGDTVVKVVSNTNQYYLYMSAPEDKTALTPEQDGVTTEFAPLEGEMTRRNFTVNSWGFSTDDTLDGSDGATYKGLSNGLTLVKRKSDITPDVEDETKIYFGLKADSNMQSATYTGSVIITVFSEEQ